MAQYRHRTGTPRDTTVNIKVSKEEKAQLQALATAAGLTVGGYLLGLALGEKLGNLMVEQPGRSR